MKLYADPSARRVRQAVGDLLLLAWVAGWLLVARVVHETTMLLARPGEEINQAGSGLAERLRDAGSAVDDAPFIGDDLRAPFEGAGDSADQIAAAGVAQVEAVDRLALWLSTSVGVIAILAAVAFYLPPRWRSVREAAAGRRLVAAGEELDLFALRALSRQPLHRLARVSSDPAAAWRRRDPEVVRELAVLELGDVGLRPPSP